MGELRRFSNLIEGAAEAGAATFESFDPYRGAPWALVPRCNASDVERAVTAAKRAFRAPAWRDLTPTARGKLLVRLSDLIGQGIRILEFRPRRADLEDIFMTVTKGDVQ